MTGKVIAIFISPKARAPMQSVQSVRAMAGRGLEGDRYSRGDGSFNRKKGVGNRQVTLMNMRFLENTPFSPEDTRRNIFVEGVELMRLIGREFTIGNVRLRGVKYCEPCNIPSKMAETDVSFAELFHDRGGLIAEILTEGVVMRGDTLTPPPYGYER